MEPQRYYNADLEVEEEEEEQQQEHSEAHASADGPSRVVAVSRASREVGRDVPRRVHPELLPHNATGLPVGCQPRGQ